MECKAEQFGTNAVDFFDIPAAEQEITVGSSEQPCTSLISSPLIQNRASFTPAQGVYHSMNRTPIYRSFCPTQPRGPRVIMVQRAGQVPRSICNAQPNQGFKAVKIITVPGQGAGGKPLRAAVIPMHMLQRGMKVLTSQGHQTIGPGGSIISSSGMPPPMGMPRVLTLRPAGHVTTNQQHANMPVSGNTGGTGMRLGTLILSGASGGSYTTRVTPSFPMQQHTGTPDDAENMIFTNGSEMNYLQTHQHSGAGGGFFELSANHPHAQFNRQISPSGRDSDNEQEHVATGLKTNGLRRYARCVCNKVKEKGITSYSEVADELVHEYAAEHPMIPSEQLHYIQKNIRRRVYDALNVLMALSVLQKEKKEIRWVGLPVNMIEECRRLEEEREKRQISLRNKTAEIQELILQLIAFKNLVVRNSINERYRRQNISSQNEKSARTPSSIPTINTSVAALNPHKIDRILLPFLVVSTNKKTVIDCNISNDKLEYLFSFDQAFEIRDEVDTLKRMGLTLRLGSAQCTQEEYNQCLELIPPSLRFYVEAIFERRQAIVPDFEALHQQRRLFVESRLAEAAAASTDNDQIEDESSPHRLHSVQSTQSRSNNLPSAGGINNHFTFFDSGLSDDSGVRQLQLQRSSVSNVLNNDLVPGDTQHYARTAASRGFVVPGGPGGLLRHRNLNPSTFSSQAGIIHRQAVKMTVERANCSGDTEGVTASSALSNDLRNRSQNLNITRGLLNEEDEFPDDDDEDDDEDDDDMEDVQDVMKRSP